MNKIDKFCSIVEVSCLGETVTLYEVSLACEKAEKELFSSENWERIRRKAIETVTGLGVPVHWGKKTPEDYLDFPWDGKGIYVEKSEDGDFPRSENILHEAAHYLLAARRRRSLEDFGLGSPTSVRSGLSKDPRGLKNSEDINDEESAASALGIALVARIDLVLAIMTAEEHNWFLDLDDEILSGEIEKWRREAVGCRKRVAPPLRRSVVHWMKKIRDKILDILDS
ncbi:MAG: hypothetical protein D6698_16585 [Gammaproteobacteria bacterium]|nr:MAG: hypothetical protein D6698_16585 [Gammaproteobacteria bacterium]